MYSRGNCSKLCPSLDKREVYKNGYEPMYGWVALLCTLELKLYVNIKNIIISNFRFSGLLKL